MILNGEKVDRGYAQVKTIDTKGRWEQTKNSWGRTSTT